MERLVISAKLKPDMEARAIELIRAGPPFDPETYGLQRHGVYLADSQVIFLFEGPWVDEAVRSVVNDQVTAASFSSWAPLLEEGPRLLTEVFIWEAANTRRPSIAANN